MIHNDCSHKGWWKKVILIFVFSLLIIGKKNYNTSLCNFPHANMKVVCLGFAQGKHVIQTNVNILATIIEKQCMALAKTSISGEEGFMKKCTGNSNKTSIFLRVFEFFFESQKWLFLGFRRSTLFKKTFSAYLVSITICSLRSNKAYGKKISREENIF